MGFCKVFSAGLWGLEGIPVEVEVDSCPAEALGLQIVGLPDAVVRESKDRVLTAIKHSGITLGNIRATVNLAPSDLKKEGPLYDLPIALGLLAACGHLDPAQVEGYLVAGELGLSGTLKPLKGALALAMLARAQGANGILLPAPNGAEAAAVPSIPVVPASSLKEALHFLRHPESIPSPPPTDQKPLFQASRGSVDLAEICGQEQGKRALEIAAAGGHNLLMVGPPGSGKTMLAKALVGLMPPLSVEEALEVTRIHSVAGFLSHGQGLVTERPFRSPHHTVSYAGLIGGGQIPRPGEVSLAHHGILFLDELCEFSRATLEVLRQPLEDRQVTISRAGGHFTFPTRFLCVAAMNPCPCGFLGHPDKPCTDTEAAIHRYRGKISGPLLDRLDMVLEIPQLRYRDLSHESKGEPSAKVALRVERARGVQTERLGGHRTNALLQRKELAHHCALDGASQNLMRHAVDSLGLSARAHDRLLRLARTIADLDQSVSIVYDHLLEALNYRLSWNETVNSRCVVA